MQYPIERDGSYCTSSCIGNPSSGHISRIHFAYAPPADAVFQTVEIRRRGDNSLVDRIPLLGDYLGYTSCAPRAPELEDDGEYCARMVVYDAAGNTAGYEVEACSRTRTCAQKLDDGTTCHPSNDCDAPTFGCHSVGDSSWTFALLGLLGLAGRRRR
jgi:MYXO-CTERM domain-containing protein